MSTRPVFTDIFVTMNIFPKSYMSNNCKKIDESTSSCSSKEVINSKVARDSLQVL